MLLSATADSSNVGARDVLCFPAASLMQTPLSMCLAIVIRLSHAGSLRA
jgi:hypothetical protein